MALLVRFVAGLLPLPCCFHCSATGNEVEKRVLCETVYMMKNAGYRRRVVICLCMLLCCSECAKLGGDGWMSIGFGGTAEW